MNRRTFIASIPILLLAASCDDQRNNFDVAIIPQETVNFSEVNSAFDDYNPALEPTGFNDEFYLIFSSNRNSQGEDFDFTGFYCWSYFSHLNGEFFIGTSLSLSNVLLDSVNSGANEFSPRFEPAGDGTGTGRLFYASDAGGNLDIRCIGYGGKEIPSDPYGTPVTLTGLNSPYDEAYLCLHPGEVTDREVAYFTSDRNGSFDIFRAEGEPGIPFEASGTFSISRVNELSSSGNDKCPYIAGSIMVFTSDRTGGQGGFDLYYSKWNGSHWTAPEPFGAGINTEFNEYRPVIYQPENGNILNDLLVFSSDRSGGKGGYDLYFRGLGKGLSQ